MDAAAAAPQAGYGALVRQLSRQLSRQSSLDDAAFNLVDLPGELLALILYRLLLAHDIAQLAPLCSALRDAARLVVHGPQRSRQVKQSCALALRSDADCRAARVPARARDGVLAGAQRGRRGHDEKRRARSPAVATDGSAAGAPQFANSFSLERNLHACGIRRDDGTCRAGVAALRNHAGTAEEHDGAG